MVSMLIKAGTTVYLPVPLNSNQLQAFKILSVTRDRVIVTAGNSRWWLPVALVEKYGQQV